MKFAIVNGLLWRQGRLEPLGLALFQGRILAIGSMPVGFAPDAVLDARGAIVLPGFMDLHTHLEDRIGSFDLADSCRSGTEIAVRNGITTLFNFVTQQPPESLDEAHARARRKAAGNLWCDYGLHLTPTRFLPADWEIILEKARCGFRTFKFYTTYRQAGLFCSYEELETIFQRLAAAGAGCLVHAEDEETLCTAGSAELDFFRPPTHARMRPPEAEIEAIGRILPIARRIGIRLHFVHVSTREGAQRIRAARQDAPVTCETGPQYLFLDESWLHRADGHRWLCSPPLRSAENRASLAEAARQECFDLLATDHCAFRRQDKDGASADIRTVPNGIAGIGALPHLAAQLLGWPNPGAIPSLVRMLSENPARGSGLWPRKGTIAVGSDADLVLVGTRKPEASIRSSLSDCHETYPGFPAVLDIRAVILRGTPVMLEGQLIKEAAPRGILCQRP